MQKPLARVHVGAGPRACPVRKDSQGGQPHRVAPTSRLLNNLCEIADSCGITGSGKSLYSGIQGIYPRPSVRGGIYLTNYAGL